MVCERDKNVEITPVFNDLQRLFQQSYEGLQDFSVSIGYAKYDESLNYIPKFIEKADHYMYLNKNVKKVMKMSHGRSMCMPKRKAKILIVDDAQINRIILCELLGINIKF